MDLPVTHSYVYRNIRPQEYIDCTGAKTKTVTTVMRSFGDYTVQVISSQSYDTVVVTQLTTTFGALLDTMLFSWEADVNSQIEITLSDIYYEYHFVDSPVIRRGLYANETTGSPQISIEEAGVSPFELFDGDLWYTANRLFFFENGYTSSIVLAREDETTWQEVFDRINSEDPYNDVITATSFIANEWLITSQSGLLNANWSGGLFMPDVDTVSVYGNKDFAVPSGNLHVSKSLKGYLWSSQSWDIGAAATYDGSEIIFSTSSGGGTVDSSSYAHFAEYAPTASRKAPLATISSSIVPSTLYQSIYTGSDVLPNGVYWVKITASDAQHTNEIYTGRMAWMGSGVNSDEWDEIPLHRMGVNPGSSTLYLRTARKSSGTSQLELAFNQTGASSGSYTFEFVQIAAMGGGDDTMIVLPYFERPPISPSAFDDEFTTPTIDAKWTVTEDATATGFVVTPNKYETWLSNAGPGASSDYIHTIRQALSGFSAGAAFTMTTRLSLRKISSATGVRALVYLGNNSTRNGGDYVQVGVVNDGGRNQIIVHDGSYDFQETMGNSASNTVWFHVDRDTSNVVRVWVSTDGADWRLVNSETRNWDASYLFVILLGHSSAGNPGEAMCDFVRFNDSRFIMPV